MSPSGDDDDAQDRHTLAAASTASLDEPSHGSSNPAEGVEGLLTMPRMSTLELQSLTIQSPVDVVLEGEHLFGTTALFMNLATEEIRELLRVAERITLESGEALFSQGEEASALYVLQSGEVQVRAASELGEDIVLAMLGPGSVIGELALIDGGPRSATVEAISDCLVYRLEREAFDALREQRRPAAYKVILGLAASVDARRRQAEARIAEVFEDPAQHIDQFESQVHDMLARLRKV